MNIAMLGEGAWGTAVAMLLAYNGHEVKLWCYNTELVSQINETRHNERYLPGVTLPKNITAVATLDEAMSDADWVFEAIPVKFLRSVLEQSKHCYKDTQRWVVLSKGIEQGTLFFPTEIIADVLGDAVQQTVFAGPSFAMDVARKEITAVTIAAPECELAKELQELLANDYFRPYISTDMIGVQLGSALKNVIAIGVGMLDGAGYTDNAKAFMITRGLHEIAELAVALGGKQQTVYGLSGVGDLILTAMGSLSRNLQVGKRFGQGQSLESILKETGYIPEGINTVESVQQLMRKHGVRLSICLGIYEVIFNNKPLEDMLKELMREPLSYECGT